MSTHTFKVNKFLFVYAVTLFLCFSPFKKLSLFTPLIVVFLLLFFVKVRQGFNFLVLLLFALVYLSVGLFYFYVNSDFLWTNFLFFFITTSPFLLLLISFKDIVDSDLVGKMSDLTIKVLFIEAILGIIQMLYNGLFCAQVFDGGTGDAAMGTINPTFGVGDGLGSNVYYAIALSALTVLVVATRLHEKIKINSFVLMTLILGWIAASVVHSIFLLMGSILINIVIVVFFMPKGKLSFITKQLKVIVASFAILGIIVAGLLYMLPNSVPRLKDYYTKTFNSDNPKSTKAIATIATFSNFNRDKPYQKFIGVGPGQYSSKASMILSGTYLSANIPDFMKSVSPDLRKNILPIWLEYKSRKWQAGSTFFPFYSWLSLYGEFGLAGCVLLLFSLFLLSKKLIGKVNQENFKLILGLLIVIFYVLLLGVQDNYWEWAQFILPIVLYAKTAYYIAIKSN